MIVVPLLRAGLERDRRGLVGRRRQRADDRLTDRRRAARAHGADVLPARRLEPGRALPGPLAAGVRAGTSRSRAGRSARPGAPSNAETFFSGLDVRALDFGAAARRPTRSPPTRPSTPRSRTGRARPTGSSRGWTTRPTSDRWTPGGASSRGRGRGGGRPPPPPPPDPDQRGGRARLPRRPAHRAPARHRAADAARDRGGPARRAGTHAGSGRSGCGAGPRACERLLVLSPDAVRRVPALLGVAPERVVWAPNGFDPSGFDRRPLGGEERLAHWRRWLVEEPRGWDESGEPGACPLGGAPRAVLGTMYLPFLGNNRSRPLGVADLCANRDHAPAVGDLLADTFREFVALLAIRDGHEIDAVRGLSRTRSRR